MSDRKYKMNELEVDVYPEENQICISQATGYSSPLIWIYPEQVEILKAWLGKAHAYLLENQKGNTDEKT